MAKAQSTECLECKSSDCGLQLKCMHSFCPKCLQKMYNDDQTLKCTVCYAGANKVPTSKQRLSVDHSILDASNVTEHVLIQDKFVVTLTTENCHCKAEYDKDLKIAESHQTQDYFYTIEAM
ncbi:uncharacterized protein LOC117121452 isoform X2 [Anneissia japonica]|uniref:uncharacterized protein LOC117121452 isoform X2 n=1 Tax=Anneissia japonica TaxID=1529436 RepID=UPI0014256C32|nr:uncharacterized protein LOC117121452 isoform X2 [Anneissia japonica]